MDGLGEYSAIPENGCRSGAMGNVQFIFLFNGGVAGIVY